jgi:hypothetical protein
MSRTVKKTRIKPKAKTVQVRRGQNTTLRQFAESPLPAMIIDNDGEVEEVDVLTVAAHEQALYYKMLSESQAEVLRLMLNGGPVEAVGNSRLKAA